MAPHDQLETAHLLKLKATERVAKVQLWKGDLGAKNMSPARRGDKEIL